jgi:uncharacterized RDD family membrane protein YckC
MGHVRRIVLFSLIALAILVPFLAAAMGQSAQPAQFMPGGRSTDNTRRHPTAAIQAAGSKDSLWIMIPQQSMDGKTDTFKLWAHDGANKRNGQDIWDAAHDQNGVQLPGLPSFLATQVPAYDDDIQSSAVVIYEDGRLMAYSPSSDYELPYLPDHQRPAAVTGGGERGERFLFVLARGPRVAASQPATQSSTQPASAPASQASVEKPATAPAATTPSTASAPATNAAEQWNLLHRVNSKWFALPDPSTNGPSSSAHIVIATQQDQLWILWYEPSQPDILHAKSINWRIPPAAGWSATIDRKLAEPMTRIQLVTVPQMILLWPVKQEAKGTYALHGVTLSPDGKVDSDAKGDVRSLILDLGDASKEITPERDIAVAQLSNSIAVIIAQKDDSIQQLLFTAGGTPNGPPVKVDPAQTTAKPTPGMETARIAVIMGLMAISLWFWRKQPPLLALPKGTQMAALGQRIAAGVVDMSLPLMIVVLGFQLYDTDKFTLAWQRVLRAVVDLDFSTVPVELLWFVGIYLVHVTISEMVNGRSLGKVVFGLMVVGLNGKRATPLQIFLRNIIRLAEWLAVVPILAPVIPPLRQRIGDIIARTLVVQMHTLPPEPPEKEDDPK